MKTILQYKRAMCIPEPGTPCQIKAKIRPIEQCVGFFVADKNLVTRRTRAKGKVVGYVPGAGGDLWWVEHEDKTVAAYCFDEVIDPKG